jgi:hypothetical protein
MEENIYLRLRLNHWLSVTKFCIHESSLLIKIDFNKDSTDKSDMDLLKRVVVYYSDSFEVRIDY